MEKKTENEQDEVGFSRVDVSSLSKQGNLHRGRRREIMIQENYKVLRPSRD